MNHPVNPMARKRQAVTWRCLLPALALALQLGTVASTAAAEEWGHRIAVRTDIAYGDDPQQTLDMILQGQRIGEPDYFRAVTQPRPTLVWIHGGGWLGGDKSAEIGQLVPYLQRGWNVFNLNYRQGPNTAPAAADDVLCAYRFIIEQLGASGQATDQVVVSGASAGGHLALLVGLLNSTGNHPCRAPVAPRAIVNWFGITDIEQVDEYLQTARPEQNYARRWAGSAAAVAEVSADYSPMFLLSGDTPPIISIHGTQDSVVPYEQGEALHAALNTPNELVTLKGGNHSGFSEAQYQEAYRRIFTFLDAH